MTKLLDDPKRGNPKRKKQQETETQDDYEKRLNHDKSIPRYKWIFAHRRKPKPEPEPIEPPPQ